MFNVRKWAWYNYVHKTLLQALAIGLYIKNKKLTPRVQQTLKTPSPTQNAGGEAQRKHKKSFPMRNAGKGEGMRPLRPGCVVVGASSLVRRPGGCRPEWCSVLGTLLPSSLATILFLAAPLAIPVPVRVRVRVLDDPLVMMWSLCLVRVCGPSLASLSSSCWPVVVWVST